MAATRRAYTGGAQSTTTSSAIASSGTTSFTITAYTGWPYGSDPFFVVVEPGTASEEKILVTRTGSTDTTVNIASDSERGQDGTSAVAHSSGSTVFPVFTALDADEANELTSSWSTKGDLVSYGSSTFETLGVGADDTVLIADSGETSGLKWSNSLSLSGLAVDTDTLYVDSANDRVGIGTTTPAAELHVASSEADLYLQDTDGTLGGSMTARLRMTDSAGAIHGTIGFSATGSGTMVIDNHDGPLLMRTLSNDSVIFTTDATGTPKSWTLGSNANTTFPSTGVLVSVGTYNNTTGAGANMHISSGGFFYRSTSSAKYKTDVETLDDDHADIVFRLRPVWYRSTTGNDPTEWSYYGLIAEEVAEVDPRLASFGASADCSCPKDDDGNLVGDHDVSCLTEPEGVYYDRLVPHLISVVQRQQAQIDALEARLAALESSG